MNAKTPPRASRPRLAEVNRLRGDLETVHLAAQLATASVLTADQTAHYNKMRGY